MKSKGWDRAARSNTKNAGVRNKRIYKRERVRDVRRAAKAVIKKGDFDKVANKARLPSGERCLS